MNNTPKPTKRLLFVIALSLFGVVALAAAYPIIAAASGSTVASYW